MNYYSFYFSQPWWLLLCVILVPVVWLARRNLTGLGRFRRFFATVLRGLVIFILIAMLAGPTLTKMNNRLSVIAVVDRSRSIPEELQQSTLDYLAQAVEDKDTDDRFAIVDVAERATISKLPTSDIEIRRRNTTLTGQQSRLEDGIELAMAIAPPDTATRIVLVSEGNETAGDLKQAAENAAANGIPIDVLAVHYQYDNEVVFKSLVVPSHARTGQTVDLRFVLESTSYSTGALQLELNGQAVDMDPMSPGVSVPVELQPGTNVRTISIPLGKSGLHEFEALFIPDTSEQDKIEQNNKVSAITNVTGPGSLMIVDADGLSGRAVLNSLQDSDIQVEYISSLEFPDKITGLIDVDAVILANTDCSGFTYQQQQMLNYYVTELGGGLIMTGGPDSFGAGGWIGSPVAEILPIELDPPEKQQLPSGALVLVIDRSGSMTGDKVEMCKIAAAASVRLLSSRDYVGVVVFDGACFWQVELARAVDKSTIVQGILEIGAGGGTTMGPAMKMGFDALQEVNVAVKHMILLTDGQTSDPDYCYSLIPEISASDVTVSTVAVGPQVNSLLLNNIAMDTEGRFYRVDDPMNIPEIFVKEAQVVRRNMIIEQPFVPQIVSGFSELTKGLPAQIPVLDGYVLTAAKGGLNQIVMTTDQADPLLAVCQAGIGRSVAFTSSIDSRWAADWLQWNGFAQFWEQTIRWAAKPGYSSDIEFFTNIQDQQVEVEIEAIDDDGRFLQFTDIDAQVINPDVSTSTIELTQTGPGQYSGWFKADSPGSYIVNMRYKQLGENEQTRSAISTVTIPFAPEFRDLTDNMSLLTDISRSTGGRLLSADPNQANLYDYTDLKFPQAQITMTLPLIYIWLVLFLMDVAVRRVAIDIRAILRKINLLIHHRGKKQKADQTLEQLKLKRLQLQQQLTRNAKDGTAAKRYEADLKSGSPELSEMPFSKSGEKQAVKKHQPEEQKPAVTPDEAEMSHIQKLLRAKRQAGLDKEKHKDDKDT